jgi:hypothetical protein
MSRRVGVRLRSMCSQLGDIDSAVFAVSLLLHDPQVQGSEQRPRYSFNFSLLLFSSRNSRNSCVLSSSRTHCS